MLDLYYKGMSVAVSGRITRDTSLSKTCREAKRFMLLLQIIKKLVSNICQRVQGGSITNLTDKSLPYRPCENTYANRNGVIQAYFNRYSGTGFCKSIY